jgi:AAA family ATP:ADP antiporter
LSNSTTTPDDHPPAWLRWLRRAVRVERAEAGAMLAAFLYFFFLLCGYYILRPLRDEMGIVGGVKNLPWLFTGTFIAMLVAVPLFGAAAARLPRRTLVPAVYGFFIINIGIFWILFQDSTAHASTARAFFIWLSVFNLFVVSVFWSFMVDIFRSEQGKRLFGFIAAGGTTGAVTGPLLTTQLVGSLGPVNLLPVSGAILACALGCVLWLNRWAERQPASTHAKSTEGALGGSIWAGFTLTLRSRYLLAVAAFIWIFTTLATFVYFEQAHIVKGALSDSAARTVLFAKIDLAVNTLTILTQIFITGRLLTRFGVTPTLSAMPVIATAGFALLAALPGLAVLIGFQVVRRAGDYAITRPAREMLFTVVDRETKYKAKNFIDTVVYRGGDAIAGWLFAGLGALGLGTAGIAAAAVPLCLAWMALAVWLGRAQKQRAETEPAA